VTAIADADFPTCSYVEWVDNYFVVAESNSDKFYISALDDATDWTATDFASAEKRADNLVRPIWFRGDLLLIGEQTSELYYNSGNADFPWDPFPNAVFEFGTNAPASAAIAGNALFVLAQTREGGYQVMKASTQTPTPISNRDLEWQIEAMSAKTDAFGFCYQQSGHTFYMLTFPSARITYCYDDTTGLWHERQNKTAGRHRAGGHVFFNGKHLVGDYANANFYELSTSTYMDDEDVIERIRQTPIVHKDRKLVSYHAVELELESGVGLTTGQGSNPQVMMSWSDDRGATWSTELWASMGKIGEYNTRARWHQLGSARERQFRFKWTDPVDTCIVACYADIELGLN